MNLYNPFTGSPLFGKTGSPYRRSSKGFFTFNNKTIYFDLSNLDDYRKVYALCPPLKAVISKRANQFVNGKVEILNRNTESTKRGAIAKQLKERLKRPNVLQSWKQFFAQFHTYIDLWGYCPVLKIEPAGMEGQGEITALWILPPWLFRIYYTGKWQNQTDVKKIYKRFTFIGNDGTEKDLEMNSVCVITDNNISTATGIQDNGPSILLPDSRVKSLEYPISNIIATYKSRNSLITKKGAIGILSNYGKDASGPIKMEEGEKERVQEEFQRYNLNEGDWQVIISDATLQWQAMSFPTKDLMLFEEIEDDILRLCDGIGEYPDLMGSIKKSTFANVSEAKKAQYQDNIIPDAESRIEQLSSFIIPESENAYLWISYSHLEVFQDSVKTKAEGLKAQGDALKSLWELGLITRNGMLEELDRDKVTGKDEQFEVYKFEEDAQNEDKKFKQQTALNNSKPASGGL